MLTIKPLVTDPLKTANAEMLPGPCGRHSLQRQARGQRTGPLQGAIASALWPRGPGCATLRDMALASVAAVGLSLAPILAHAATFTVDNSTDGNDGSCSDGDCSLREAIQQANSQSGADIVDASMVDSSIRLVHGEFPITDEITIDGAYLVVDAHSESRIFNVAASAGQARMEDVVLLYGSTSGDGGAIVSGANLYLDNVTIANSSAGQDGGAIAVENSNVDLEEVSIYGNTCGGGHRGGGLAVSNGSATIASSTISDNSCGGNSTSGGFDVDGGNVYLTNSTVSGNHVDDFAGGFRVSGGTAYILHSTISGNSAGSAGGFSATSAVLYNSIVANNEAWKYNDWAFSTDSLVISHSLVEGSSTPTVPGNNTNGNIVRRDPRLGALSWNGGATKTHELLFGSPAFNAGDPAHSASLDYDQRGMGFQRAVGNPDMGAVEVVYETLTVTSTVDPGNGTCDVVECTLREAIEVANQDFELDIVTFVEGLSGTVMLNQGAIGINSKMIIRGPGSTHLIVDAGGSSPAFFASRSFGLHDVSVINGYNSVNGGAIAAHIAYINGMVILDGVVVTNSHADGFGGGVQVRHGTVRVLNSTISGNSSSIGGGGLATMYADTEIAYSTISDNIAVADGGAVRVFEGDAVVLHSTVNSNQAGFNGGGVFVRRGSLKLDNSTINGNNAVIGGGFAVQHGDSILYRSTITGNQATQFAGGFHVYYGELRLRGSIVADNMSAADVAFRVTGYDSGTRVSNSLVEGSSSPSSVSDNNILGQDPQLGSLQDNGGLTATQMPQGGSIVVDWIPSYWCSGLTDQRGVERPQGIGCDIGAVEQDGNRIFSDGFEGSPTPAQR